MLEDFFKVRVEDFSHRCAFMLSRRAFNVPLYVIREPKCRHQSPRQPTRSPQYTECHCESHFNIDSDDNMNLHSAVQRDGPFNIDKRPGRIEFMDDDASYICDSCGEEIVIPIDPSEGSRQDYVEDCPVCCNANVIHVDISPAGEIRVHAEPELE